MTILSQPANRIEIVGAIRWRWLPQNRQYSKQQITMKKNSQLILLGALLFITPQVQSCQLLPTISQHFSQQQINRKLSSEELQQIAQAITVKVIGGEAGGSGTIIRKVGSTYTVVTNQHVLRAIQGTSKNRVEINNDDELTVVKNIRIQTSDGLDYPARIVTGENINFQDNDLGLLEFNADRIYDVGTFPKSDVRLKAGEKVWAAGFPSEPSEPPLLKLCLTHIFLNNPESIACLGLSVVTKLNTYLGW